MKKLIAFINNSIACVAPYTVINTEFRKQHFCWSAGSAIAWAQCYDPEVFGATEIYNFNGIVIATFE